MADYLLKCFAIKQSSVIVIISTCFRLKCNIRDPECLRDILINSAKHLGSLKFDVWKKMATIVHSGG